MPARAARRIIPIHTAAKVEFRVIGGKLYLDRPEKAITWASCQTKDGVQHAKPPKFITRTLGTKLVGAGFLGLGGTVVNQGQVSFTSPKFSTTTPSCIDDKLKQRN